MHFVSEPNLVLEALAYLGARANGHSNASREERLRRRGVQDLSSFFQKAAPLGDFKHYIDQQIHIPQEDLQNLFHDIDGFPFNTTGSYSTAFLLYYPLLASHSGDFVSLTKQIASLSDEEVARNFFSSLSMEDRVEENTSNLPTLFLDCVLSMAIPSESKLALISASRNYRELYPKINHYIDQVLSCFKQQQKQIHSIVCEFTKEIENCGCEAFLQHTSKLVPKNGTQYELRPYLFGPDTNLVLPVSSNTEVIYCGVLRPVLQNLLNTAQNPDAMVYEAIKLLGDKTRFDILCALKDRAAYGQELAEQLGLAPNTIHHHMSKLLNAGLVICNTERNRVYYSLDKDRLTELLQQQHDLLIGE